PIVSINDSVDNTSLTASPPAPTGTNDWQHVTVDFKTKPKHEGISVGLVRPACNEKEPICPIFGTVWYDDFNLQRLSGPGSARSARNGAR
ncbi:MAG TPA: hypothetical protein VKD91_09650, partial [Pyrinomonadaceae bacterium]|nr:hypothetical protein [Pyrinomonadaceae bacterium]